MSASASANEITIKSGGLHSSVDDCERVLANTGRHFHNGGGIVQLSVDPATGSVLALPMNQNNLTLELSRSANFKRFKADGDSTTIDPPGRTIALLKDMREFRHLQRLNGIATQPFIANDRLCISKGFDEETGMYSAYDPKTYNINETPSREEAEEALERLEGLLSEFEFKSESDHSATLCAILTAVTRVGLDNALMILVKSNVPGSGKTYLVQLITAFASLGESLKIAFPRNDDECQKVLIATFMKLPSVIDFDNLVTDVLPFQSLCTALTSTTLTGRILGESKMVDVATKSLLLGSGNNIGFIDDMIRRGFEIELDPKEDNPENRSFERDPVKTLRDSREDLVSDALTIVLAYIHAGKPKPDVKNIAGFEQWSSMCRDPLLWLGLDDPCTSMFNGAQSSPGRKLTTAIIDELHAEFNSMAFTVRELVERCKPDLFDLLAEVSSDDGGNSLNRRKLGWWLRNKTGHRSAGKRLVSVDSSKNAKWCVEVQDASK